MFWFCSIAGKVFLHVNIIWHAYLNSDLVRHWLHRNAIYKMMKSYTWRATKIWCGLLRNIKHVIERTREIKWSASSPKTRWQFSQGFCCRRSSRGHFGACLTQWPICRPSDSIIRIDSGMCLVQWETVNEVSYFMEEKMQTYYFSTALDFFSPYRSQIKKNM